MNLPYASPEELATTKFDFGLKQVEFLQKQWEFTWAQEIDIANRGGLGSSKTLGGIYRATQLSCFHPGNQGIIGRFASTDLAATTRHPPRPGLSPTYPYSQW